MDDHLQLIEHSVDRVSRHLAAHRFPEVARALRARSASILNRWRARSIEVLPDLDRLTIAEFESSIAIILDLLSGAMECHDPSRIRLMIAESPAHGLARFRQKCSPHTLLAEERILRGVLILELREELHRPLTAEEAAVLHELIDLLGEYSLLAMIGKRSDEREHELELQVTGLHRLADMGILAAGVAHDAINLLLPLRMQLEHIERSDLSPSAREDLLSAQLLIRQFQNLIVNLRWLSVDAAHDRRSIPSLDLHEWSVEVAEFNRRMLPRNIDIVFDLPPGLPPVGISSAALSQAAFNLIRNAQQAIASQTQHGRIVVTGYSRAEGGVDLTIEDDGPGMSADVLKRCAEPFFTTRSGGSGLGLALVKALIVGYGGRVEFHSPPLGKAHGTIATLALPLAGRAP